MYTTPTFIYPILFALSTLDTNNQLHTTAQQSVHVQNGTPDLFLEMWSSASLSHSANGTNIYLIAQARKLGNYPWFHLSPIIVISNVTSSIYSSIRTSLKSTFFSPSPRPLPLSKPLSCKLLKNVLMVHSASILIPIPMFFPYSSHRHSLTMSIKSFYSPAQPFTRCRLSEVNT